MQLFTVGLLFIQNKKLLLAYSINKQCYYLPGGKIDKGETAVTALCREIAEELGVLLNPQTLTYYTHITAPAYGEPAGTMMEQDCYTTSQLVSPSAAAEIGSISYFNLPQYLAQPRQAPGAVMILQQLTLQGLID
jgi:8-oxo-dGTP pyrophosphatase MutT (NUDIX family)